MAPKKKSNKKNDDWESELGETADPIAAATQAAKDAEAAQEADPEEEFGGGGLMATMKKNRKKLKAKGKLVEEEPVSEEAPAVEDSIDLAEKAPVEASIDDEFALPEKGKKGKGAKSAPAAKEEEAGEDDDERGADGKVLTKKEKEKLKKAREQQRKKENVRTISNVFLKYTDNEYRPPRKRQLHL